MLSRCGRSRPRGAPCRAARSSPRCGRRPPRTRSWPGAREIVRRCASSSRCARSSVRGVSSMARTTASKDSCGAPWEPHSSSPGRGAWSIRGWGACRRRRTSSSAGSSSTVTRRSGCSRTKSSASSRRAARSARVRALAERAPSPPRTAASREKLAVVSSQASAPSRSRSSLRCSSNSSRPSSLRPYAAGLPCASRTSWRTRAAEAVVDGRFKYPVTSICSRPRPFSVAQPAAEGSERGGPSRHPCERGAGPLLGARERVLEHRGGAGLGPVTQEPGVLHALGHRGLLAVARAAHLDEDLAPLPLWVTPRASARWQAGRSRPRPRASRPRPRGPAGARRRRRPHRTASSRGQNEKRRRSPRGTAPER